MKLTDIRTQVVAQASNLLYRRFVTCRHNELVGRPAGWKPVLQQIPNLRHASSDSATRQTPRPPTPHAPRITHYALRITRYASRSTPAFTLIELILVMALLTIAVSVTAPTLSRFFRGRTLDSEARRLLALTREGQSRAVSEGVPMDLWLNAGEKRFGLQAEPSYEDEDPKAVELQLDSGLQMEVVNGAATNSVVNLNPNQPVSIASVPRVALVHPDLPTIRFLPDGSISDTSPRSLQLIGRDGASLWLVQTSDGLAYEIRKTDK